MGRPYSPRSGSAEISATLSATMGFRLFDIDRFANLCKNFVQRLSVARFLLNLFAGAFGVRGEEAVSWDQECG